jgi:hypothetical protein
VISRMSHIADHATPSAYSCPGCTQGLAQRFCAPHSRTLRPTDKMPGNPAPSGHTSIASRPPVYTRLPIHVLVGLMYLHSILFTYRYR